MRHKPLLLLWAILFGLCAALGFLPEPEGSLKTAFTAASIIHFLPPLAILYRAKQEKDMVSIRLIRNLACLSLLLTVLLLIGNFLSARAGETLGNLLYYMLIIISSPMICSGLWALSLFLWACLLMASLKLLKK